jgi:hypothetical protein
MASLDLDYYRRRAARQRRMAFRMAWKRSIEVVQRWLRALLASAARRGRDAVLERALVALSRSRLP